MWIWNFDKDEAQARIAHLLSNCEKTLRKYQDMEPGAKQIYSKTKDNDLVKQWSPGFIDSVHDHVVELECVTVVLTALCVEKPDVSTLPEFLNKLDHVTKQNTEINDWAHRFIKPTLATIEDKTAKKGKKPRR